MARAHTALTRGVRRVTDAAGPVVTSVKDAVSNAAETVVTTTATAAGAVAGTVQSLTDRDAPKPNGGGFTNGDGPRSDVEPHKNGG